MKTQRRISQDVVYNRQVFIEQAIRVGDEMARLLGKWELLTQEDSELASIKYPFGSSFDEIVHAFFHWYSLLQDNFIKNEFSYLPTVTVGELKETLKYLNDNVQVVMAKPDHTGWANINEIELPDEDEGMFTLTFHTKSDLDTTQF